MKYLTTSQKDRYKPYLLKRDGAKCFYCNDPFVSNPDIRDLKPTFDHLDNNPKNNDKQNLVLCHWKCNQLKKTYTDYQILAQEKIRESAVSFDSLSESEATAPIPASKEIDLNVAMKKLTWEYIQDRLVRQGKPALNYNDTADSVAFIFWQKTGHGSSQSIKRYLNEFSSSAAPFRREEQDGETLILKR